MVVNETTRLVSGFTLLWSQISKNWDSALCNYNIHLNGRNEDNIKKKVLEDEAYSSVCRWCWERCLSRAQAWSQPEEEEQAGWPPGATLSVIPMAHPTRPQRGWAPPHGSPHGQAGGQPWKHHSICPLQGREPGWLGDPP